MLKAMLHGKLGRPDAGGDDESTTTGSAWDALTGREDPLTAAVFERIAYLDPADAWTLLRTACRGPGLARLAETPLPEKPVFWFWPKLSPGEGGFNARHVEPDVLIGWGDLLLVVEAKHGCAQEDGQWVEEIRATQGDARFAGKHTILIAAGGADPVTFAGLATAAAGKLEDCAGFVLLRWEALREAAESLRSRLASSNPAILDDMIAALEAWGYRRRIGFDSLPAAARHFSISKGPADLADWRIR